MKRITLTIALIATLALSGCTFFQQTQIRWSDVDYDAQGHVTNRQEFVYKNPKDATAAIPAAAFVDGADPNLMASISSLNSPVIDARGNAHLQSLTGWNEVTQSIGDIAGNIAAAAVSAALNAATAKTAQLQIESDRDVRLKELEPVQEKAPPEGEPITNPEGGTTHQ